MDYVQIVAAIVVALFAVAALRSAVPMGLIALFITNVNIPEYSDLTLYLVMGGVLLLFLIACGYQYTVSEGGAKDEHETHNEWVADRSALTALLVSLAYNFWGYIWDGAVFLWNLSVPGLIVVALVVAYVIRKWWWPRRVARRQAAAGSPAPPAPGLQAV